MVRAPRYMWPFHSERSSFWQPLGFASIAAVTREVHPDVDIEILDCPVLRMGWKSTKQYIRQRQPDIICIGEETVSAHEAIRLARFAREEMPDCMIIAGGPHFSYMVEDTLLNHPIDFIVRFEGEYAFRDLITQLKKGGRQDLSKVPNLCYRKKGEIVYNDLADPVDMESLPIPAYDLLPMQRYGEGATSHPDLVAIEHSRGCPCSCNFCILWKQFGKIDVKNRKVVPCYRTKSPQKVVDEVRYLVETYGRKTFCWVDPTWNVDPAWNEEFAERMLKSGLEVNHSVWMRADYIVRDEERGIFNKLVQAGVKQAMVGVERTDDDDLAYLDKAGYTFNKVKKAFEIIRSYPEVLSVATYIYGIPNETRASLRRFYEMLKEIPFDIGVPIPITPNPGTRFFDELQDKKLLEVKKFRFYNFVNPIARSKYLSKEMLLLFMLWNEFRIRTRREQFALFFLKGRRRNATKNLAKSKTRMTLRFFQGIFQSVLFNKELNYNIRPEWYDS